MDSAERIELLRSFIVSELAKAESTLLTLKLLNNDTSFFYDSVSNEDNHDLKYKIEHITDLYDSAVENLKYVRNTIHEQIRRV